MAQKSLLSLIQTASAELNLPTPSVVTSSQNGNDTKLLMLARAVCDDLLHEHDWQFLQTRYQFTTTSGIDNYAFPSDMQRYINGTFFDQNNRWPLRGPKTPREWEFLKVGLLSGAPFERFRVYGNRFFVAPTPGTTNYTFVMEYISSSYVLDGSSMLPKADFTQDSDICMFDHRLVVYGIKLKWKASNEQDTSEALADYNRTLALAKGADVPAPVLSLGSQAAYPVLSTANYPDGSWIA